MTDAATRVGEHDRQLTEHEYRLKELEGRMDRVERAINELHSHIVTLALRGTPPTIARPPDPPRERS